MRHRCTIPPLPAAGGLLFGLGLEFAETPDGFLEIFGGLLPSSAQLSALALAETRCSLYPTAGCGIRPKLTHSVQRGPLRSSDTETKDTLG